MVLFVLAAHIMYGATFRLGLTAMRGGTAVAALVVVLQKSQVLNSYRVHEVVRKYIPVPHIIQACVYNMCASVLV